MYKKEQINTVSVSTILIKIKYILKFKNNVIRLWAEQPVKVITNTNVYIVGRMTKGRNCGDIVAVTLSQ
jgi:hypothetical protein